MKWGMDKAVLTGEADDQENALDWLAEWVRKKLSRFDVVVFLSAFVLGVLVHMYMFTHKFINHDDIWGLYSSCEFGLSSGRWLLHWVTKLVGGFSSSWLNGLVGVFCLAVAVVFVVRLFGIRRYAPALLIALTMVAFPVIASTYSYMFCSYQYLVALMFCAMGAYFIYTGRAWRALVGSGLIAMGMGCYQAYFALSAVLLVTVLGVDICFDRYRGDWKKVLAVALRAVGALALGMVLYMLVLRLCLWLTGTALTTYQGMNTMGQMSLGRLIWQTLSAYYHFFTFFLHTEIFRAQVPVLVFAAWALCIAAAVVTVIRRGIYRSIAVMILLLGDCALLPLGAELVYVMVGGSGGVHFVMQYAVVVPILLPAIFADRLTLCAREKGERETKRRNGWTAGLALVLLLLQLCCGYEFFLVTNRAYFDMDVTYESVYAYYVKLAAKLELQEGYTEDTPVAFIGTAAMETGTAPTYMTGVLTGEDAANIYTRDTFLRELLASDYNWADEELCEALQNTDEFQKMPCYPAEGSIATIDGVIVVKLS